MMIEVATARENETEIEIGTEIETEIVTANETGRKKEIVSAIEMTPIKHL